MKHFALGLAFFLSLSPRAHAATGPSNGGGGTEVESAFRLRGYQLIAMVAKAPAADKLCAATTLRDTLAATTILVVDQLLKDGQPIQGQDLDAYTTPLSIQLLKASWTRFFHDGDAPVGSRSLDALILHEVLRATGGTCPDDNFARSGPMLDALAATPPPPHQSQIYRFAYKTEAAEERDLPDSAVWCVAVPAEGKEDTCLVYVPYGNFYQDTVLFRGTARKVPASPANSWLFGSSLEETQLAIIKTDGMRLNNLMGMINPEHPLYVVFDYETGALSAGFDPTNLQPVQQ